QSARAELAAPSGTRNVVGQNAREAKLERIREIEIGIARYVDLITATVVRHEIAHQVLTNLGIQGQDDSRRWLCGGLAMQFKTTDPPNRYRLADFFAESAGEKSFGIASLISDPKLIGPGARNAQQAYAAAWALAFYLIEEDPYGFKAYMDLASKHENL